jgi:hypothetical protein
MTCYAANIFRAAKRKADRNGILGEIVSLNLRLAPGAKIDGVQGDAKQIRRDEAEL